MHPGAIGPALQEQAFQLLGNKGWGILGWQSTLNPPAPGPIKVGGPLMSLRQCRLAPAHQGCQTGSYQSGIHPGFIEKQLVCQTGRNSILERTPRKRLQPTMLFASRISQRQGPHTPSPRFTCAFQGVWEPRSNVHPQLVPDFSNRSLISKGQGQAHTSNRRAREARSGPQRPWGGHTPGTEVVEGSCGVRRHAGSVHSFLCRLSFVTLLLRQAGKGVILSVTIWLCARTAAAGLDSLPVWIPLSSGCPGHSSESLWTVALCRCRADLPTLPLPGKPRRRGAWQRCSQWRSSGAKWPRLHFGAQTPAAQAECGSGAAAVLA